MLTRCSTRRYAVLFKPSALVHPAHSEPLLDMFYRYHFDVKKTARVSSGESKTPKG